MQYGITAQNVADHARLIAVAKKCGIALGGYRSKEAAAHGRADLARVTSINVRICGYIEDC